MSDNEEQCSCVFQDVSETIHLDPIILPKNMLELAKLILESCRKFIWDMSNIWNPRFQFIYTQATIRFKLCIHEGVRLLLFVHPKSLNVEEEGSLWLQRPIVIDRHTTNMSIVKKKLEILFREVVDECQTRLMRPNSK